MTVAFRASEQHHRHSGMRVFRLPPPRHLPPRVPIKPCPNSKRRARTPAVSGIALGHPPPKALRGCAPARTTTQTATGRPRSPPTSTGPSAMTSPILGRRRGDGKPLSGPEGRAAQRLGRRRGRGAGCGGGPRRPPWSRGSRTAGGADAGDPGRRDDEVRRPRRLPRPDDGRRSARERGDAREAGGGSRAAPRRGAETRGAKTRHGLGRGGSDWAAVNFTDRARGAAGGIRGSPRRQRNGRGLCGRRRRGGADADDDGDGDGVRLAVRALSVDDVAGDLRPRVQRQEHRWLLRATSAARARAATTSQPAARAGAAA